MVITEIQNKEQAESFLSNLKNQKDSNLTDRSYAIHLLFLVSGLEIESANLILETLSEIDEVTGPYIACHLFLDKIEIPIYETLSGIYDKKPIQESKLNIRQIEGICKNGKINHVEMDKLSASNLTSANEMIARKLGVVDKVPCVVIFDSVEVVTSGTYTIMPFPKNRNDLSALLRGFLGLISKDKFKPNSIILERIHELYDEKKKLNSKIGAPLNHKVEILTKVLKNISTNYSSAKLEIKRVSKKLGINYEFSDNQISLLSKSNLVNSNQVLNDEQLTNLISNFDIEFDNVIRQKDENEPKSKIDYLTEIRNAVIDNIVLSIEKDNSVLQESLQKIELEIQNQVENIKKGPSIVKSMRRHNLLKKSTSSIEATLIDTIKSGIKDLAKPSFWIKLFLT